MISPAPVTLEGHGVRLEPLDAEHVDGLAAAAADGRLWELWYTNVPEPDGVAEYVATALEGQRAGHMLPWAVRELAAGCNSPERGSHCERRCRAALPLGQIPNRGAGVSR
jgi:hypothetical protein